MELWTPILIKIGLGPTFYGENGSTLGMVPFIIDHIHLTSRGYSLAPNPLSFRAPTGGFCFTARNPPSQGFFPPFSLWKTLATSIYTSKPRNSPFSWGVWRGKEELPTGFYQYIRRNLSLQKETGLWQSRRTFFSEWPFRSSLGFLECWYTLPKTDIAPEFWVSAYFFWVNC